MSTLRPTRCLVLALIAVTNQMALAEETTAAPAAKPADATPAAAPSPAPAAGKGLFSEVPVHGYLKSQYRARWTGNASDQDIYETLSLDVGDPDKNRVTAHFLGDLVVDIDGNVGKDGYYPFDSARDSNGNNVVSQIYNCYVDIHRLGALSLLRAGRQTINEIPDATTFDGLSTETRELGSARAKLGAYGGVPYYQYQGRTSGDFLGGAYGESRLWKGSRARVDWELLDAHNGSDEYRNTLLGFSGWQSIGRSVDLYGNYTRKDGKDRDVLARGTYNRADWDFRFQASYYQLFDVQRAAVIETDSYYPVMQDYVPYREVRCVVSKGVGEHVNVDAGVDTRQLVNADLASNFNHQFNRYFGTLDLLDLLGKGSSISLTGDKWMSADRNTESAGVDITCPVTQKGKVSVGTAHYMYKYDYATGQESDDVQSYYLNFEYKYSRALRLKTDYTYDNDGSAGTYNELRCEAICTF